MKERGTVLSTPTPAQPERENNVCPAAPVSPRERGEERVEIRAARLRMTTDRRLGRETPDWVQTLAKKPL